jgi:hypothetical protein
MAGLDDRVYKAIVEGAEAAAPGEPDQREFAGLRSTPKMTQPNKFGLAPAVGEDNDAYARNNTN